jgi:hypothetical protein
VVALIDLLGELAGPSAAARVSELGEFWSWIRGLALDIFALTKPRDRTQNANLTQLFFLVRYPDAMCVSCRAMKLFCIHLARHDQSCFISGITEVC